MDAHLETTLKEYSFSIRNIVNATDVAEVKNSLQHGCNLLGFQTFNISIDKTNVEDFMTEPTVTSWSFEAISSYIGEGFLKIDPLLRHVAEGKPPLTWDQAYLRRIGPSDYAAMVAEREIEGGMTIPLPAKEGMFSAMTFLSLAPRKLSDDLVSNLAGTLGHVAMRRMAQLGLVSVASGSSKEGLRSLSDKQLEILRWVAEGKSNHEIAIILDLPRKQVNYHVQEILRKLGVSTRTQVAVIYASR